MTGNPRYRELIPTGRPQELCKTSRLNKITAPLSLSSPCSDHLEGWISPSCYGLLTHNRSSEWIPSFWGRCLWYPWVRHHPRACCHPCVSLPGRYWHWCLKLPGQGFLSMCSSSWVHCCDSYQPREGEGDTELYITKNCLAIFPYLLFTMGRERERERERE